MRAEDGAIMQNRHGKGPCCAEDVVLQRTQVSANEEVVVMQEHYCGPLSYVACVLFGCIGCILCKNADVHTVQYTRKFEMSDTGVLKPRVYREVLPPLPPQGKPQVAPPPPVAPMRVTPAARAPAPPPAKVTQNPLAPPRQSPW